MLLRSLNLPTAPPDLGSIEQWEAVRWAVVTGDRHAPHMDAAVAAWMDAGIFARHTLVAMRDFKPDEIVALLGDELLREMLEQTANEENL